MASADGSVIIEVNMNTSKADKTLGELKAEIEKLEKEVNSFSGDKNSDLFKNSLETLEKMKSQAGMLEKAIAQQNRAISGGYDREAMRYIDEYAKGTDAASKSVNEMQAALENAENSLKSLESQGQFFGDEEYDKAYQNWKRVNDEIKLYKKELTTYERPKIEGSDRFSKEIADAEQALKSLSSRGLGFGDEEYDKAFHKLSRLRAELKVYKQEIAKTPEQKQQEADKAAAKAAKEQESAAALAERTRKAQQKEQEAAAEAAHLQEIARNAEVSDQRIADLNRELEELKARLAELDKAGVGLGYAEYDAATQRVSEINQQLQDYKSNLTSTEEETQKTESAAQRAMEKFRELPAQMTRGVASAAKNGLSALKTLTIGIVKAVAKLNVFSRVSNKLGSVFKQLGSTIKSALVFSVIYQGLSMVKQQLGSYLMANAEFTAALGRLKGVLLTAFQPIYDVVVPALVTLMNVLSSVIAAISRFTSALFGRTAKQSQTNAKALYGQAKATEAAGSAAEEAAGSLAAFDEINTIQTENAGGGGGGGGGGAGEAGAPEFDFDYGEEAFQSWGEAFNAFLGNILENGIPRLREGLLNFANWLNWFSQKLYDMFTFPGVKEKVIQIGQDLANAFNDLVNRIDWNLLGMALGAGLNLAILGMVNFLYTFDWINFGMKLAAFINGAVSQIDWYAVGMLLWSGFKIAIETLAGFIIGLNMPEMAAAASDLIIGFFNSVKETIDNIDWKEIGEQIREFLVNIKWKDIADSVFGAIESAFTGSSDFFSGLLGDELKKTLTDLMIALGEALLVIGALLAFTGVNIPLGLGLMAKGALALAGAAALDWQYVSENIKNIISEIALLLGSSLLFLGVVLTLSGANIPLGIGLIVAGAASLAAAAALNWDSIITAIQGTLGTIIAVVSGVLLALGLILCLSGVGIPLGIALIAAGAVGLVSVTAINWNAILDKLKGAWGDIKNWWDTSVKKYFTLSYWIDKGKEIIGGFVDGINKKKSEIADAINDAIPKKINVPVMTTSVSTALNVVKNSNRRMVSAPMPTIAGRSIPALAAGAVIPPNREFLAVLGDQRSGTNIEAPLATIEQAVEHVISRMGGAGGGDIHITVELDGRVVARNTVKHINDMTRSAGTPVLLI